MSPSFISYRSLFDVRALGVCAVCGVCSAARAATGRDELKLLWSVAPLARARPTRGNRVEEGSIRGGQLSEGRAAPLAIDRAHSYSSPPPSCTDDDATVCCGVTRGSTSRLVGSSLHEESMGIAPRASGDGVIPRQRTRIRSAANTMDTPRCDDHGDAA